MTVLFGTIFQNLPTAIAVCNHNVMHPDYGMNKNYKIEGKRIVLINAQ